MSFSMAVPRQSPADRFARLHSVLCILDMLPPDGLQKPRFVLPPQALVERFEALFTPIQARVDRTVEENESLAALRDALLPKLISGELRVPDAERIVKRCL
jgi:type I restriction enzyme, S subunit